MGSSFNLFENLGIKDMEPRLSILILKIFDKQYKIFYKKSNKP